MKKMDSHYWKNNYANPQCMDGMKNARDHANYLKAFLDLEHIHITTMVDLGCGYGSLFKAMLKAFVPYYAVAIEPSEFAFKKVSKKKLKPVLSTELHLFQEDIKSWSKNTIKRREPVFDLGVCTSVFQYLSSQELNEVIPMMAKKIKILYLTVPTDLELLRQKEELDFDDEYAISRSRMQYQKILSPYFTCVSSRVWESKLHFNEQSTQLTDLLYRN